MIAETLKEGLGNKVERIPQRERERVERKRDRTQEVEKIEKYWRVSSGDLVFERENEGKEFIEIMWENFPKF